jgi:hypothetical protein
MPMQDWLHKYPGVQALLQQDADVLGYCPDGRPPAAPSLSFSWADVHEGRGSLLTGDEASILEAWCEEWGIGPGEAVLMDVGVLEWYRIGTEGIARRDGYF